MRCSNSNACLTSTFMYSHTLAFSPPASHMPSEVIDVDVLPDQARSDSPEIEYQGGIQFTGFKRTRTPAFKLAELEAEGVVYMGYDTRRQRPAPPSKLSAPEASGSKPAEILGEGVFTQFKPCHRAYATANRLMAAQLAGAAGSSPSSKTMGTTSKPKKAATRRQVVKAASARISKGKRRAFAVQVYVEVPTLSAVKVCVGNPVTCACHSCHSRGPEPRRLHTKPLVSGEYSIPPFQWSPTVNTNIDVRMAVLGQRRRHGLDLDRI